MKEIAVVYIEYSNKCIKNCFSKKTKKDTFARKSIQIKIAYMLALIGKLADSLEIISDIGVEPFRESFSGLCYYQKPNGDKYEGCDSIILFELYYQTFHLLEMEDTCNYVKAFFKMAFNNTPANRATFPIEILYTESFYQESVVAIPYLNHTIDLHKLIDNYKNLDEIKKKYHGEVTVDHYGRAVPKHAHGTSNLPEFTSSTKIIMAAMEKLFDRIINWNLLIRRINVVAANVIPENKIPTKPDFEQMDLFTDYAALEKEHQQEKKEREKPDTKRLLKKLLGSPMKKLRSINEMLFDISQHLSEKKTVSITYFVSDKQKSGGAYLTDVGIIKKIDEFDKTVLMDSGMMIPMEEIRNIEYIGTGGVTD